MTTLSDLTTLPHARPQPIDCRGIRVLHHLARTVRSRLGDTNSSYESRRDFAHHMQVFLQLFSVRTRDNRTWVSGVPSELACLFCWLGDILVLHVRISSSSETTLDAQYPVVHRFAESIRAFVPWFEVYLAVTRDEERLHGAPECDGLGMRNIWSILLVKRRSFAVCVISALGCLYEDTSCAPLAAVRIDAKDEGGREKRTTLGAFG